MIRSRTDGIAECQSVFVRLHFCAGKICSIEILTYFLWVSECQVYDNKDFVFILLYYRSCIFSTKCYTFGLVFWETR